MLSVIALWGLFIIASRVFEPHNYPAGDPRNEAAFWLVAGGAFLVPIVVALAVAIRLVVGQRRK
jgi:hypothetical protein